MAPCAPRIARPHRRTPVAIAAVFAVVMVVAGCAQAPQPVPIDRVASLSSDQRHACAVRLDGRVWCWGANYYGQLANGSLANSPDEAVRVPGISGATTVSAGRDFTCATLRNGQVRCWGYNLSGQVGDGTDFNLVGQPDRVVGVADAWAVAAGSDHACAVTASGTVSCWGRNWVGQLGDGTSVDRNVAAEVPDLARATAITSGDSFSCALGTRGEVRCWGINDQGQLGDGTTKDRTTPVLVDGLPPVTAVSAGLAHVCAIAKGGAVWCWGSTAGGELGLRHDADGRQPVEVQGAGPAVAVAAATGDSTTCATDENSAVRCWGGDPVGLGSHRARPVRTVAAGGTGRPRSIEMVGSDACVVDVDGTVRCAGT